MTQTKVAKLIAARLKACYGRSAGHGDTSAWAHMSTQHRQDAILAAAAHIILSQADSTALSLRFADAQTLLRKAVAAFPLEFELDT